MKAGILSLFCYQLSVVYGSGIPLLDGLKILADEIGDPKMKEASMAIHQDIQQGKKLSEAIETLTVFPEYLKGMLRIAEDTGSLDQETYRLSLYYEKQEAMEQRIKNAVTYPMVLFVLMGAVVLLLILQVLPLFHQILLGIGGDIPGSTQVMMQVSQWLSSSFGALVATVMAVILVAYWLGKSNNGKERIHRWQLKLPILGPVYSKMIAFRMSHALYMLTAAGVAFDDALSLAATVTGNEYARGKIEIAEKEIRDGKGISQSLEEMELLPEMMIRMLRIGEQTGEIEGFLERSAQLYEQEAERALKKMTTAIEPVLVTILSVVVGIILMTVMMPLIQIISTIG